MDINKLQAYELIQEKELDGIHSQGYYLKHKKSGAKVLLLPNEDDNKVFYIGFRTPPDNSTGVAHILEHSVLCGSRDFPVKDPFVELVKGSLNTFLNAMTYPDKTVYPVASCNDKDFQNLMHVYMDAVFYPNIYQHKEIFQQEGWSYHLEQEEGPLTYNGVVYNEMKGAYSSPEGVLERVILNSLFPDTTYVNESGGDPEDIPKLSYEQFLDFHRRYYHPSNSYIYLYGNMDMEEKLKWMDENYLCHFEEDPVDSAVGEQKAFKEMIDISSKYSIASNESEKENTYLSYNKVVGTTLDPELYQAFEILDYALLSAPGAPLKKALLEAEIGKDIMGSYDNGIYQPIFSVVAKNAEQEQKAEFVKLVESTLRGLADKGINKKALLAGINYQEFRFREADFGGYPKGLMYGLQILDSWLYDDKQAFLHLDALPVLEFLKSQVDKGYFEELIRKYLLENPHGSIVTVVPEKGRTARMDQELADKLEHYRKSLTPEQRSALVQETKNLQAYQEAEDDPEAILRIPILEREDISREVVPAANEVQNIEAGGEKIPFIFHEIETEGIGYLSVFFNMRGLSEEQLPYVGILQAVLGVIDTENYEYGELFNEINVHTGGIGTSLEMFTNVEKAREKDFQPVFEIKGKALYSKQSFLTDMMAEILTRSCFNDAKRLKEILHTTKSRLQMRFQSAGHTTSVLRALSYASPIAKWKDDTDGIGFYQSLTELVEQFEERKEEIIDKLFRISEQIFCPQNMLVSWTGTREGLDEARAGVKVLTEALKNPGKAKKTPCVLRCEKRNEGFKTSSKVQYVARTGNFLDKGLSYTGALQILKVILSYDYLWQNVRVKGGAYGCMSSFNRIGEACFVSYRDPHLKNTLQIYEGIPAYLRSFNVSDRDMKKYVIGTISNLDRPMTPAAKGERSMNLYMNHVTEEMLREERRQVLEATQEDIRALADIVEAVLEADQLCVIGNEEKLVEEKELFKELRELF